MAHEELDFKLKHRIHPYTHFGLRLFLPLLTVSLPALDTDFELGTNFYFGDACSFLRGRRILVSGKEKIQRCAWM